MSDRPASARSRTCTAILDAAALAFRELGFERTSMEEIARRADVARGTLYYNFVSKEDIATGVAERFRAEGYAAYRAQRAAGVDTLTLLQDFFARAGPSIAENRAAFFIATLAAARGLGRSPDRPGTTMVFTELVAQGQAEGVFRKDVPSSAIARLLAALLTQAALQGPDAASSDVADWPLVLLRTALGGVLAPDRPAS